MIGDASPSSEAQTSPTRTVDTSLDMGLMVVVVTFLWYQLYCIHGTGAAGSIVIMGCQYGV